MKSQQSKKLSPSAISMELPNSQNKVSHSNNNNNSTSCQQPHQVPQVIQTVSASLSSIKKPVNETDSQNQISGVNNVPKKDSTQKLASLYEPPDGKLTDQPDIDH